MRLSHNTMARRVAAFLLIVLFSAVCAGMPAGPDARLSGEPPASAVSQTASETVSPMQPRTVKTILLLTSYPVADIVTSNFFDAFRKGIRELNLPIDCHVVELNATLKDRDEILDSTFERMSTQINSGVYSLIVTLNYEAAKMIMTHYRELSRDIPVLFAGLGRVPADLKRLYPNSSAIGIADDTSGTLDLAMRLFPEARNLALVVDDSTISEETRQEILSKCKLHFPQLDYVWINAETDKRLIQETLAGFPNESLILFFPSHDYANGHDETLAAFVRNVGFDRRFPCLALDDTLLDNGVVAGSMIETNRLGHEAARMAAQILNTGNAQRVQEKSIVPRRIVDYEKFKSYKAFSGRIPLGVSVINKPETVWTRHWQTFLFLFFAVAVIVALQSIYFSWMRRRLRLNRNMLYSMPGRVCVLNRAETILFASWVKDDAKKKSQKVRKLEELPGIDYPKLSKTVHDVFQSGRQVTIEYDYEDVHRAMSFALLEHEIFGQDAVICFSLDNTELQNARREAEKYAAELKKNTRMWEILINFLPIHIYAKDIDNDFRYVFNNRTRAMFYGFGENELDDKTDFDFLPHDFAARMRQEDEEFVARPEQVLQERNVDMMSRDGRVQHLRCIQRVFTDADGTRLLLGTAVNITELEEARIQMQQLNAKLQELLEQHSVLLDNMPSFVITKDIDDGFRIITCNEACLQFVNLPLADVVGRTDHDILHNQEDADFIHTDDLRAVEVLKHSPEYLSTGHFHDLNGNTHIGKFYRKLISASGNRRILFTLFHDVTDLEDAKRAAEENADRFLLTLRSIGDGVITTDANGDVTLVNPNAEKMLGRPQAEMLGKPHTDYFRIVHAQTGTPFDSPLTAALQSGEVAEGADLTDLLSADGRRYHIASSAAPIRTRSGNIAGAILVFRDVTEEQNKREELRQAMASLENASGMARLASFRYELKSRRRSGSTMLRTLWPDDENGEPLRFEDWVHPDDVPLFDSTVVTLERSGKTGETIQISFRVGQTSSLRYYRAMVTLDAAVPGEPALTGILQDVTELTLSTLKLKDTQALWDAAINAIPIMFTVKDIDHDFRYMLCNNAYAEIFNRPLNDIIGHTDHEIFREGDVLRFADRMNNPNLADDATESFEAELVDAWGRRHYIKTVTRVLRASGHNYLLAASSDVTDMQKLIQNQTLVNELLQEIISEDDFDMCLHRTLENVCRLLGASRGCLLHHEGDDDSLAHCVSEYVDPRHPHSDVKMLGKTLSRVRGVLENTPDRRTFICNNTRDIDWGAIGEDWQKTAKAIELRAIFLSNIIRDGKVWGTVGFNFECYAHTFSENDITLLRATAHIIELVLARKHAQMLVMDALERAQAADRAKSFFIASVSHEIRTPLNSVIGFAELLREGGVSKDVETEYLSAISSSANALLMLINDVLDLSKLEANQMQIVTAFTDFKALCREVLLIFSFRAKENANKLVFDVPDMPELDIDNIRVRQILINLLGNAVKFTKKGSITLSASFTPETPETGSLSFSVRDTGIGISEEDQKKLMEPFVQLSRMRGTNAVNNGTGLGLSISKRLAVCMNGTLTCNSAIGEGSTFGVVLHDVRYREASSAPKPEPEKASAAAPRDLSTIRVLVVDDVPMNLRVVKALFVRIGITEVSTALSGREALDLLEKQPVDLILSDMWMPEMNGSQFSAEVRRNPKIAHIPIVAQTADVETSGNFDMSNFNAIILKPITKEKLSDMVRRIIIEGDAGLSDSGPLNLG